MAWFLSDSLAEYAAAAAGLLRRPARNTVLLGATETIRVRGAAAFGDEAPLFGWWAAPGEPVSAAFMHTPPFGPALTSVPAGAAAALAETFAARGRFPAWVNGDTTTAPPFAAAWERHTGEPARSPGGAACTGWAGSAAGPGAAGPGPGGRRPPTRPAPRLAGGVRPRGGRPRRT